jgi:hypothetical protein
MTKLFDRFITRAIVIAVVALLGTAVVLVARATDRQDAAEMAQLTAISQDIAG